MLQPALPAPSATQWPSSWPSIRCDSALPACAYARPLFNELCSAGIAFCSAKPMSMCLDVRMLPHPCSPPHRTRCMYIIITRICACPWSYSCVRPSQPRAPPLTNRTLHIHAQHKPATQTWAQINAGQVAQAEELLDRVLAASPRELGARVARGTARALRRDLKGARG